MKKSIIAVLLFCSTFGAAKAQNINTFAGNGTQGYSGDGGLAVNAALSGPFKVASDAFGNIYIADTYNQRIRKVESGTGIITTIAGNGIKGYSGDGGLATNAEFNYPFGVAVDAVGNVYVADGFNHSIRKIESGTGIISTIAGNGIQGYSGDGGSAIDAELGNPSAVEVDAVGNLYISDFPNNVIRKVASNSGIITTIAGNGTQGYSGDGGLATNAELYGPEGVVIDGAGNVYIADNLNNSIRKVASGSGIISTIAGNGTMGYSGDGSLAINATLGNPEDVALDAVGNLYISDLYNNRIRKVDINTGVITTIAGNGVQGYSGDGGLAGNAELNFPEGIAIDATGNLFISDQVNNRIREVVFCNASASIAPLPDNDRCGRNIQIFLGYGSQSIKLSASATGGSGFTYAWSPSASLNNAAIANPLASPTETTTYTVTATSSTGCVATATVVVHVMDIRCGKDLLGNQEVNICNTILKGGINIQIGSCLSTGLVNTFLRLNPNACLGQCSSGARVASEDEIAVENVETAVNAYPNPFASNVNIEITAAQSAPAKVLVVDMLGKTLASYDLGVIPSGKTVFNWNGNDFSGHPMASGIYLCKISIGDDVKTIHLAIQK